MYTGMDTTNFSITYMITIDAYTISLAILTAVASGVVGSFALMRGMALAGVSLSHVALPGIGIALIYSFNPVLGAVTALVIGSFLIWKMEMISTLKVDAVIGVLFAVSLAIGALLITEEHELVEVLFGGFQEISAIEFIIGSVIAISVVAFILKRRRDLTLSLISRELAHTTGIDTGKLNLYFLLAFSFTVILGLKFLGVLLMGALIIIPAATARSIAQNLNHMLIISSSVAVISVLSGIVAAQVLSVPLGPVIIIIAGILFILSLFAKALKMVQ